MESKHSFASGKCGLDAEKRTISAEQIFGFAIGRFSSSLHPVRSDPSLKKKSQNPASKLRKIPPAIPSFTRKIPKYNHPKTHSLSVITHFFQKFEHYRTARFGV
jgi:hypothetical protein